MLLLSKYPHKRLGRKPHIGIEEQKPIVLSQMSQLPTSVLFAIPTRS